MHVIYPPTLDYAFMVQRPQQLMRQFAIHGHRVFFCNLTQRLGRPPEEVAPNLVIVHDHAAFCKCVVPSIPPPLVWCSWAKLHDALDVYRPAVVVFDCVDDFPQWRTYETAMLTRADLVTAASSILLDRLATLHGRVVLVPNGCDFDFFQRRPEAPRPSDLPSGDPIAGFIGAWAPWADTQILAATAAILPRWRFVVIGPPFGGRPVIAPNVHHLGWRPYEALPGYLHHLDAALIPFVDNQVTRAANPVKLWEYLASGCPVVSTPLPEVLPLRDVVSIAANPQEFATALTDTLSCRSPEHVRARQAVAERNSWAARYTVVAEAIRTFGLLSHV